ncbi:MAG: HAD-IIB family hydrolase [Pseudohongiellaceae bacterium]
MHTGLLVITDLDGTLLDHFSYSAEAARPALDRLRAEAIPVIPNTSKTAAEVSRARLQLAPDSPFVVENGSAIHLPRTQFPDIADATIVDADFSVIRLGVAYTDVLNALVELATEYHFTGFYQMSVEKIAALTGLSSAEAALAAQREYSEPLLWQDSDAALQEFKMELRGRGLRCLQGGRFLHVLGESDKGQAVKRLKQLYEARFGEAFITIVLGDSDNDIDMLQQADVPVVIRSPVHDLPRLSGIEAPLISRETGPAGWNTCVLTVLDQLESSRSETTHG